VFVAFSRQQWLRERALYLRYGALPVLFNVKCGGVLCSNYEALQGVNTYNHAYSIQGGEIELLILALCDDSCASECCLLLTGPLGLWGSRALLPVLKRRKKSKSQFILWVGFLLKQSYLQMMF
jgi:hypothetical protein